MSGKSRIEKILENLLGENNVIEPPIGRDEKILYSILNDLEYTEPPHSIFEELLLAIKNGSPLETEYAYEYLTRDEKILFCKLNRLEYFEPPHSRLERLLIRWLYLDLYLNIDGIPPFTFISNGSPIIDYAIYGNTVQDGTPAPDSPIMPQGTGERTAQLIDYTQSESGGIDGSGNYVSASNLWRSTVYTPIDTALGYYISWDTVTGFISARINYYTAEKVHISREQIVTSGTALTVPQNAAYFRWTLYAKSVTVIDLSYVASLHIMLNSGSTPLPYEPYGIKIPISSANTTTPVYLGEVQTTRKIRKLVLTGKESYTFDASYSRFITVFPNAKIEGLRLTQVFCTHFISVYDGRPISEVPNNSIYSSDVAIDRFFIKTTDYTSVADFKDYIGQQYAAGTPVTVWYVLAEPQTAVVNEPLMKIGDYADSISYEQTVVSIPTVSGRNTFDVLGDVKPSNVEITYAPRAPLLGKRKTILKK